MLAALPPPHGDGEVDQLLEALARQAGGMVGVVGVAVARKDRAGAWESVARSGDAPDLAMLDPDGRWAGGSDALAHALDVDGHGRVGAVVAALRPGSPACLPGALDLMARVTAGVWSRGDRK
jgi:hypothetical protein